MPHQTSEVPHQTRAASPGPHHTIDRRHARKGPLSHPNTPSPRCPTPPKTVTEPCSIVAPKATVRKMARTASNIQSHAITIVYPRDPDPSYSRMCVSVSLKSCTIAGSRALGCSNARAAARTSPPSVDIIFVPVRRRMTATHNNSLIAAIESTLDQWRAMLPPVLLRIRTRRWPLVSVCQRLLAAAIVDSDRLRRHRPHRRRLTIDQCNGMHVAYASGHTMASRACVMRTCARLRLRASRRHHPLRHLCARSRSSGPTRWPRRP